MSRLYSKLPDRLLQDGFVDLPDHLKALTIDLWLVAAMNGAEGPLPAVQACARLVGRQPEAMEAAMHDLVGEGILSAKDGVWTHELYARCQAVADGTERTRRWREAKKAREQGSGVVPLLPIRVDNVTPALEPPVPVTRHNVTETETETETDKLRGDTHGEETRVYVDNVTAPNRVCVSSSASVPDQEHQDRLKYAASQGARNPEGYARALPADWRDRTKPGWDKAPAEISIPAHMRGVGPAPGTWGGAYTCSECGCLSGHAKDCSIGQGVTA